MALEFKYQSLLVDLSTIDIFCRILVSALTVLLLSRISYRLYFHPLAKYPGPFLARITDWYAFYHAYYGLTHKEQLRCHEKYGNAVRYTPNRILFNTHTALHKIYNQNSNVCKAATYFKMTAPTGTSNIATAVDFSAVGRKRRILGQAFSEAALRAYEPSVVGHVDTFLKEIGKPGGEKSVLGWSAVRNVAEWSNYLAFDIMASLVFSQSFRMLSESFKRPLIESIEDKNKHLGIQMERSFAPKRTLESILVSRIISESNLFAKTAKEMVGKRLSTPQLNASLKDVFSFILAAKDPETGEGMSVSEIWSEAVTLIIAGSNTSSTALAATLFYLSQNHDAYNTAIKEIRTTFQTASSIVSGNQLTSCVYLSAALDEAMRMTPPAGSALWREVLPGGITIDKHEIPAGCDVGVSMYAIHHNPVYYPRPFTYDPGRWLSPDKSSDSESARAAFAPFSLGPRNCIGKNLALRELRLAVARLLWEYDFKAVDRIQGVGGGREGEYAVAQYLTALKDGPGLQFKRREDWELVSRA